MVAASAVETRDETRSTPPSSSSSSSPSSSSSSDPAPPLRSAPPRPRLLTHFPTFSSQDDCRVITDTAAQLERSGFYWGPLGVEDAHRMLRDAAPGSFLIRDSRQKDVFFTLSYRGRSGPVSVRIEFRQQRFSLAGNERSFASLFALLQHYVDSPKKNLSVPYRRWTPSLQELCRRRVMELCGGAGSVHELPITHVVKDFLLEYPHKL